jgi:hypothetical protein
MSSLREALEQGYDSLAEESAPDGAAPATDTVETPSPDTTEPAHSTEPVETTAGQPRAEDGKFTKADKAEKIAEAPKAGRGAATTTPTAVPGKTPAGTVPPVLAGAPVTPPPSAIKAPQSWKPAAREAWAKVPPELQAEIARVDKETLKTLQENARLKSQVGQGDPMAEMLRPYEGAIRAQGVEPKQYVSNVLSQAHVIFNGPPHTKAEALADVIMQAGVPPELLDRALVARMQGGQAPQMQPQQVPQYRDPRVDQLFSQIEAAKAQKAQQAQAEAETTAESFSEGHEFYGDVAPHMADILEVWAKQGKTTVSKDDLERAYTLACQMNPDVAPLLEQRRAAEAAQKAMASTARAKTAASSVRNQPTSAPPASPNGRRAVLEEKYDELANR